jgi:hypothetical protein
LRGRWVGGGAPAMRGRTGLGTGGGAVRRWFRMNDIFYQNEDHISIPIPKRSLRGTATQI